MQKKTTQNRSKISHQCESLTRRRVKSARQFARRHALGISAILLLMLGSAAMAVNTGNIKLPEVLKPIFAKSVKSDAGKRAHANTRKTIAPEPILRLPTPAVAINTNLDQLQNGTNTKTPEWANGNINTQNSCYAEGDVVPYRYFVSGISDMNPHVFTMQFEFTKGGKHAFAYLTNYDFTESGPLAAIGGPCSNTATNAPGDCVAPNDVATFPDPTTFLNSTGYMGAPIAGTLKLYGYNVTNVTFDTSLGTNGYVLQGSAAASSDVELKVSFKVIDPTKTAGFFWGAHLAKGVPTYWGVGTGSGSISGAPFHMRAIDFDNAGAANQDRSIQNGAICLPPPATITTDAGPYCPGSSHTATAPAGAASYTWTVIGGTITSGQGTRTINYTVNAGCGEMVKLRVAACTSTGACPGDSCCNVEEIEIPVNDTTKPVITCPSDTTVECGASTAPDTTGKATATDNCDTNLDITYIDVETLGCGITKIITRKWTATDDCGNSATCEQRINVVDTTKPALNGVPASGTVECDAIPQPPAVTATDSCDADVPVKFEEAQSNPGSACSNVITRKWTATDDCGNTIIAEQTITVADTGKPSLNSKPGDATVECDAVPAAPKISAVDKCDTDVKVTFTEEQRGTCPTIITRTWVASDDCGNTDSHTQTLTVVDTTKPKLMGVPANATVECDAIPVPANVTASDNCDTTLDVIFRETKAGSCPTIITREWEVTDDCGNKTTEQQIITVNDTKAPVLSATPGDEKYECLSSIPVAPTITATDVCDTSVSVDFKETESNPGSSCNNVITRTWTAKDDCGNEVSHTQTITVADTKAPVLSATPGDASLQCLSAVPAAPSITASDACDTSVSVDFKETESNPGSSCNNVITRAWTAKDDCGNEVSHKQTITINDTTAPVLSENPASFTVQCLADVPIASVITANDNCKGVLPVSFVESQSNPGSSCNNVITRTWTADDGCNKVEWKQTITVNDTTPPSITDFPSTGVEVCLGLPVTVPTLTANDNCSGAVPVTYTRSDGKPLSDPFPFGATTISASAVDVCGNASAIRTYNVVIKNCLTGFCSYTQGGWGATPQGNNPARQLSNNFGVVFPGGIEVGIPGISGYSMLFTSAPAVQNYLPAGGTPNALNADLTNPLTSSSGVFGGQVLALKINVAMSDKAKTPIGYGNLIYTGTGCLNGMTVRDILAVMETALGGGAAPCSIAELNAFATNLNEAFDNCTTSTWALANLRR